MIGREEQSLGDLLVGPPGGGRPRDLPFLSGQRPLARLGGGGCGVTAGAEFSRGAGRPRFRSELVERLGRLDRLLASFLRRTPTA
jgi:hypothetical protein